MTLHNRIDNLKNRTYLYDYLVCPKEDMKEIIIFLEQLEKIVNAAERAAEEYPYKRPGQRGTYREYNEGWQDCLDYLGIDNLFEEGQE